MSKAGNSPINQTLDQLLKSGGKDQEHVQVLELLLGQEKAKELIFKGYYRVEATNW